MYIWASRQPKLPLCDRKGTVFKMHMPASVLVCDSQAIPPAKRPRYKDLFARLASAVVERQELTDGYAFRLRLDELSLVDIAEWMTLERLCCPFWEFQLNVAARDEECTLTLRGPEGVKAFLDAEMPATDFSPVRYDSSE